MATEPNSVSVVSIPRATVAGGLAFGIFYVTCWLGIPAKLTVSHMFIQLFTTQPIQSTAALTEGLLWSVVFGAFLSFLVSTLYRFLPIGRR